MKKIFTCLTLGVLAGFGAWAENVVFFHDGGSDENDGTSVATAVKSITKVMSLIGDEGGTVVLCGNYKQGGNYPANNTTDFAHHSGLVTFTQVYGGTDYRADNARWELENTGRRFQLGGPTTFRDITFEATGTKRSSVFFLLIGNGYPVTIDTGCEMKGFSGGTLAKSFSILGGGQDDGNRINPASFDTHITINSGEVLFAGFNRGAKKNAALFNNDAVKQATAHITINGGTIINGFCGSVTEDIAGGNVDLKVNGGRFADKLYVGNYGGNWVSGQNVNVTVTGGEFDSWSILAAPGKIEGQTTVLDITGMGDKELKMLALTNVSLFNEIKSNYKVPAYDWTVTEEFTASDGTVLPYRIHVPEGADGALPVVLYLHGNGSRGTDNLKQLNTVGSATLYPLYNHSEKAIFIAPQCPSTIDEVPQMWVEREAYPGSTAYLTEPMSNWLTAANELLDATVAKYNADKTRLYVTGSSNGAGATWSLLAKYPEKFAAGIPVAGARDAEAAAAIAEPLSKTPIWTFHGTSDETLPVAGTQGLVAAIKAAGGNDIKYTEVEGADHNTIWSIAAATPEFASWMFSKKRSQMSSAVDGMSVAAPSLSLQGRDIVANADGKVSLTVFDLSGRVVSAVEGRDAVRVAGLEKAMYIVAVDAVEGRSVTKVAVR